MEVESVVKKSWFLTTLTTSSCRIPDDLDDHFTVLL